MCAPAAGVARSRLDRRKSCLFVPTLLEDVHSGGWRRGGIADRDFNWDVPLLQRVVPNAALASEVLSSSTRSGTRWCPFTHHLRVRKFRPVEISDSWGFQGIPSKLLSPPI